MDITSYLLGKNASGGGGGGLDWSSIGYDSIPQSIIEGYNYAKEIYDNWVVGTSLSSKFSADRKLVFMPLIDTSPNTSLSNAFRNCFSLLEVSKLNTVNVTNMGNCFQGCNALKVIPEFNTSNVTSFSNMFSNCNLLNDESLNNILNMCINASSYTGTKTLATLGIQNNANTYPVSRIQALPNYQAFLDAGWTIGY